MTYGTECEIVALPNVILIELGHVQPGQVDFAVQRLTTLQLDQVSELAELIDQVRNKEIALDRGLRTDGSHPCQAAAFQAGDRGPGLLPFLHWSYHAFPARTLAPLLITGAMGILVGLMLLGVPEDAALQLAAAGHYFDRSYRH